MKSQEKPIREWLETIDDPTIREAAISQINENWEHWPKNGMVKRLADALFHFNDWEATKEGYVCWDEIQNLTLKGKLETREAPEEKPEINTAKGNFNSWYYNQDKYTKTEQGDGTIILKPKKKKKIWVKVFLFEGFIRTKIHYSKKAISNSIKQGEENGETLLEVIEREYEL